VGVTGAVQVIDPLTNTVATNIPFPPPLSFSTVTGLAFHPSNRWVYITAGGTGAGPILVDRGARQVQKILNTPAEQSMSIAVTADGSRGFTANFNDGTITVLDTNGNSVTGSLSPGGFLRGAAAWQPLVPSIIPSACVTHNNDGTFTAKFSYDNPSFATLIVPVGPANFFSPGTTDRGQLTLFVPGGAKNALILVFDGSPLTWSVQTPLGLWGAATVSSSSKACQ
jgi:hypothetical protein